MAGGKVCVHQGIEAVAPRPRRRWSAAARLALRLATVAASARCGQAACNGEPFVQRRGSPVIERVEVLQPLPQNPWLVTLAVDFHDAGGDLGDGMAFVYFGGSQQVARSYQLRSFFDTAEVPLNATSGTFGIHMRLPVDQTGDGTSLQVGLQLEDASAPDPNGLFSNCFRMNLDFAVRPIKQAWLQLSRRLPGVRAS